VASRDPHPHTGRNRYRKVITNLLDEATGKRALRPGKYTQVSD